MARLLSYFGLLAALPQIMAFESISISRALPTSVHACATNCVYHSLLQDVGNALGCDTPRDNRCYCATPQDSVDVANNWLTSCASSRCSSGDVTLDISTMRSIYASYCLNAGFIQTGVDGWYSAEPTNVPSGGTDDDDLPSKTRPQPGQQGTKTEVSIVTETVTNGAGNTLEDVTVTSVSTAYVNPDGTKADGPNGSRGGGGDDSKWKIAVGVAVPLIVILAAVAAWLFWKRRQRARNAASVTGAPTNPPSEHLHTQASPPPMTETPISRKPVASPTVSALSNPTEISGEGVRQELNPQGVDAIPTAPPAYTGGRHEMHGQEIRGPDPGVEVSGLGRSTELPGVYERPRSELPGNDQFYRSQ